MSHIHLDRTSSAELPVVQRAGADPHCFLLMSEAKGTPGHPAPYEPSLPVPLISLLPANLQTLIQKAVVLVKVLLRQVRVVFQTRCRFVWELDWSLSPAVCWGRRGEWCALLCPAAPAPQPRHSARSAQT